MVFLIYGTNQSISFNESHILLTMTLVRVKQYNWLGDAHKTGFFRCMPLTNCPPECGEGSDNNSLNTNKKY